MNDVLIALDKLEHFSNELEKDPGLNKTIPGQLTPAVELRRITASLHHNLRFNPKKVRFSDYKSLLSALEEYQNKYGINIQPYISVLSDYIEANLCAEVLRKKKTGSLALTRKRFVGKSIDIDILRSNGCENISINDGVLCFHFYIEDNYDEYKYNVEIYLNDNTIESIAPIKGMKLIGDDARRSSYKSIRTIPDHYSELDEKLKGACK